MNLETLEYPPLTEDIEEAKAHLDKYGMALIANALNEDEVDEMDKRLNEQFLGEEKHKVCLLYTSPSPRDATLSRMPSSA